MPPNPPSDAELDALILARLALVGIDLCRGGGAPDPVATNPAGAAPDTLLERPYGEPMASSMPAVSIADQVSATGCASSTRSRSSP